MEDSVVQLSDRVGRRMKLRDLRVLMVVVEAGSMGKAAQRLHTSQPAISRSIAQLESAFGVPLLDRSAHGVEPTVYGRALLDGGTAVFDGLRQAVSRIEFLADPTAGEVRIGSTTLTAASFVSAVIDRFSRRYPRVAFHLVTGSSEELHQQLHGRSVDLLITRRLEPRSDEQLDFEFLFDDSFVVAAGAQSTWATRRRIRLDELANEPWVLPPAESMINVIAREAFAASGLEYPRATVVTLTPEVRLSLVATGRFITIFPTSMVGWRLRRKEIKVLPVRLPIDPVPSGVVTLRGRSLGPVPKLFIECAHEMARAQAARAH